MRLHQKYPRAQLQPEFKNAVYAHPRGIVRLATDAGFAYYGQLSIILNARRVPKTPKKLERLSKLAELIGYTGPMFREVGRG